MSQGSRSRSGGGRQQADPAAAEPTAEASEADAPEQPAEQPLVGDAPAPEADPAPAELPVTDPPREAELASGGEPSPEDDDEPRSYRARQAVYGPKGYVPAGGLLVLRPSSGLARSNLTVLVEDGEQVPAAVAAALEAASG